VPLSVKQYMDGLGRPVQAIKENYGAVGKFVKSTITYDALRREDKMYHPFESTGSSGVEAPPAYITPAGNGFEGVAGNTGAECGTTTTTEIDGKRLKQITTPLVSGLRPLM
jgi:Domain of unknown function (DUF6443)